MKINVFGEEVSLSIPATIEKFENSDEETKIEIDSSIHGTKATLKIFFVGKTPDKRIFTREFAEKLVKTLPGAPIVAYYDDESDDFIGHNATQYVYGYVPIDSKPEFKFLDGKLWAVTDLILFTERNDNIGEVARKVIGKPQSLELNPETVQYDVTLDSDGNIKGVLFKEGAFYGLSVLADDQAPAFTGSGFLTETDFMEKFGSFINQIDNGGGNKMKIKSYNDFLLLPSSEKIRMLDNAMRRKDLYGYIADIENEESFIFFDFGGIIEGVIGYYRISYKEVRTETENGVDISYEIGDMVRVYPTYAEAESPEAKEFALEDEDEEKDKCAEDEDKDDKDDVNEVEDEKDEIEDGKNGEDKEDKNDFAEEVTTEEVANAAETESSSEAEENQGAFEVEETIDDEKGVSEENQSSFGNKNKSDNATLNSEERAELEAFRLEKKERLINEYSELISKEAIESLKAKVNEYNYNDLEKELALLFAKEFKAGQATKIRSFIDIRNTDKDLGSNSTQVLVDKYK